MFTERKNAFLVKSMLGRTVELSNPDEVIRRCANLAYRDMLGGGRFYLSNEKEKRCNGLITLLEKYDYMFSRSLIEEACGLFGNEERIGKTEKRYVTRYGLAQKFVNMTFKYLYVFSDFTKKDIDFSVCDCPLDSVILAKLPEIQATWSKITPEKYVECQNAIDGILRDQNPDNELQSLGNLAFDFLNW